MTKPRSVLLIRKKYKDTFFEKNQLSDGTISSLFNYADNTYSFTQYTFNNITQMINNCLADRKAAEKALPMTFKVINPETGIEETKIADTIEKWEEYSEWNKFVLIPVLVTKDASSSNSYYGTSANIISIQHDLKPGYVRLKGGTKKGSDGKPDPNNVLKLEVVSTNFGTKSK